LDKIVPRLITSHLTLEKYEGAIFFLFRFYSHGSSSKKDETNSCTSLKNFLVTPQIKEILNTLNVKNFFKKSF